LLAPWWGEFDQKDDKLALALAHTGALWASAEQAFGRCFQGERQRILVGPGRSLGRTNLLLLDEPALGVDLPGREALVSSLDAMAKGTRRSDDDSRSHTPLEELPASTTHVALLRAGSLLCAGPTPSVLTDEHLSACYGLPVRVERSVSATRRGAVGSW